MMRKSIFYQITLFANWEDLPGRNPCKGDSRIIINLQYMGDDGKLELNREVENEDLAIQILINKQANATYQSIASYHAKHDLNLYTGTELRSRKLENIFMGRWARVVVKKYMA